MSSGGHAPELSVLMAYVKIDLFQQLLGSDMPFDSYFIRELEQYFPKPLRERFAAQMPGHPLWKEIICTVVANRMVNRSGITFAHRLLEETG